MTRPATDSVKVVWSGTGTGTLSLGAVVAGYVAFPSSLNGQLVSYVIAHDTAAERETGYGVYTHSGTTLTRVFVTSPVFGGSKVAFSGGTKHVGVAPLATDVIENRDTVNPGINDDISVGYIAGRSRWLNTATDTLHFCVDDTDGAAVWVQVGGSGGGAVDTANSPAAGEFAKFTDANTIEGRTAAETRTDLGLVVGTNIQAFDADLTTLAAQFTTASTAGSARLAFHEDTDNGSMAVTLAGPATVPANVVVTLPSAVGTLLLKEQIASGTIVARADDINFAGGADGDVLTVQADGSLAPEAPTAAVVNVDQYEIVARVAAGTGSATGFGGAEITEDATPAAGDMLLGWTAGTTLAKFNVGNLPGGGGGSTLPIADTTGVVKGSVDATKIWRVEADGFTTTTTRVLTPPNRDWAPTTFGSELTEIVDASAGRTKLGLQALATLSTVSNALIDAGAVTANQMYTGAVASAAAVSTVVDVDFATLGVTIDYIIVTDVTTLHVDLTTPATRRNVYIYNDTDPGLVFDVRDASNAVIVSDVQYKHAASLGWSGTAWVVKPIQSVLGHELSSHTGTLSLSAISDSGGMAALEVADQSEAEAGTNNTVGMTSLRTRQQAATIPYTNGTAAGSNITVLLNTHAGFLLDIDQNLTLDNTLAPVSATVKRAVILRNVSASAKTLTVEAGSGGTGDINGATTYSLPSGGIVQLWMMVNPGDEPEIVAIGDKAFVDLGIGDGTTFENAASTRTALGVIGNPLTVPLVGAGQVVSDIELKDLAETSPADAAFGGSESVAFTNGAVVAVTLTSNVTALAITSPPATGLAGAITFMINHGTGPFTWAHPSGIQWPGATAPTLSSGTGDLDIITYVTRTGGTTWLGFVGGLDFGTP